MDGGVHLIIPAFNEGRVLGETLRSLLPLRHTLVVVDDGSPDSTHPRAWAGSWS
jgi:glycosyltransferase involved in cell wall biosynthesis